MSATAIRSDWVGQVIDGRFTLLQWLGGSGRSGVFLTELPGPPGRKGAIKLTFAESDEDIERHLAGWSVTRPLSHPHLVRLLHTGRCEMGDGVLLFSVSEYADEVLSQILPERALTADEAKEMLGPIVDTLAYLHGKGLVHGHLKPSNILVIEDKLKLSGDSLEVACETGNGLAELSIHDAPERADGVISADGDLWSLGVTLVEAMTQKTPEWDRAASEDPEVPAGIPQPLAGIARGCLRADALGRCNLGNVKNWLETKGGAPAAAKVVVPEVSKDVVLEPEAVEKAGSRFPVTALVVAFVVIVAVVAVFALRSHGGGAAVVGSSEGHAASAAAPVPTAGSSHAAAEEQPAPVTALPKAEAPAPADVAAEKAPEKAVEPAAAAPEPVAAKRAAAEDSPADLAVVERVQPDVLPKALASIHGKFDVRIKVTVDGAGNVSDAAFESAGPSQYFAGASMKAVRQWKFKPGQAGSSVLQFRYTRDGAEITTVTAN